jgi:uncharacterized protein YkwD
MCDEYIEQQSKKEAEYQKKIIQLLNQERIKAGLNELEEISFMSDIAQARVEAHRDERSF